MIHPDRNSNFVGGGANLVPPLALADPAGLWDSRVARPAGPESPGAVKIALEGASRSLDSLKARAASSKAARAAGH
ncbi:MAG TPA: hypothetical protein DEP84_32820 [Chloroflexi bacterium]|nr:hypothetical protein [Chloroflexota bacterium]